MCGPFFLSAAARAPGEGRPSLLGSDALLFLPGPVLRPKHGGEVRTFMASDGGEGLGDVALEVDKGLLEATFRVNEVEKGVEEVVGAGAGGESGLRFGEVEEVAERDVEHVDMRESLSSGAGSEVRTASSAPLSQCGG